MLRNYSCDKISDRFISGRTKEREIILDKFKVEEDSYKKYREDTYQTPRCKSQTKTRQINLIENDEVFGQKIYLNLLKTQIFKSSQSCTTCSDKSFHGYKKDFKQNIVKNLNKTFLKIWFLNILNTYQKPHASLSLSKSFFPLLTYHNVYLNFSLLP